MMRPWHMGAGLNTGWVQSLDWTTGLDYWTTGLDYWTHPNCKIQLVQCRTEAKRTYSLSYCSLDRLPWSFQRSKVTCIFNEHSTMSFSYRQAYMLEECSFCYLCFSKACFQQRLEIDFCKVKCSSVTKFSIESLVKVLSSKYALPSS